MELAFCLIFALAIATIIFYLVYWAGRDDGCDFERNRKRSSNLHFYQLGFKHGVARSQRKRDAHGRYIKQ